MQSVKKIWKASGKRHATSRGAKLKARVSQLEMEKPVIQFAVLVSRLQMRVECQLTHLNNDQLPPRAHLAGLGLPDTRCRCVHSGTQSSDNPANHHLRDAITRCLDDGANGNYRRSYYNLFRPTEDISRPYCRHGTDEAANICDSLVSTIREVFFIANSL